MKRPRWGLSHEPQHDSTRFVQLDTFTAHDPMIEWSTISFRGECQTTSEMNKLFNQALFYTF